MALVTSALRRPLLGFPDVVNEYAARVVAAGVVAMTAAYVATGWGWILLPLVFGFVSRVAAGPRFSPLGRLATQVVVPGLGLPTRLVPGPPKRFAQAIGAALSSTAVVAHLVDAATVARVIVAGITAAAAAEAALGFCLGCVIFGRLMSAGLMPRTVCEACNDLSLRSHRTA